MWSSDSFWNLPVSSWYALLDSTRNLKLKLERASPLLTSKVAGCWSWALDDAYEQWISLRNWRQQHQLSNLEHHSLYVTHSRKLRIAIIGADFLVFSSRVFSWFSSSSYFLVLIYCLNFSPWFFRSIHHIAKMQWTNNSHDRASDHDSNSHHIHDRHCNHSHAYYDNVYTYSSPSPRLNPPSPSSSGDAALSPSARILSATCGSVLTSMVVTPLDVVKTRLQSQYNISKKNINSSIYSFFPPSTIEASKTTNNISPPSSPVSAVSSLGSPSSASRSFIGALPTSTSSQASPKSMSRAVGAAKPTSSHRFTSTTAHIPLNHQYIPVSKNQTISLYPSNSSTVSLKSSSSVSLSSSSYHRIYNGSIDCIRRMVNEEGIRSLWRGLTATLLMSTPSNIIYFTAYDTLRNHLLNYSSKLSTESASTLMSLTPILAGCTARSMSTVLVSPIELIRTRSQASTTANASILDQLKQEINRGGVKSLFRGLIPSLCRDVPFSAIYWSSYERLKLKIYNHLVHHRQQSLPHSPSSHHDTSDHTINSGVGTVDAQDHYRMFVVSSFISGSLSGMLAATITHPFDLIKTRRQIDMCELPASQYEHVNTLINRFKDMKTPLSSASSIPLPASPSPSSSLSSKSTRSLLKNIVKTEGLPGLYSGLTPRIIKIAPACAIMISSYEAAKIAISKFNKQREEQSSSPKRLY